jgi:hypothetical protein
MNRPLRIKSGRRIIIRASYELDLQRMYPIICEPMAFQYIDRDTVFSHLVRLSLYVLSHSKIQPIL